MIYKHLGISVPKRIHLYEHGGKLQGYPCHDSDLSEQCDLSAPCHREKKQCEDFNFGSPCRKNCRCTKVGVLSLAVSCQAVFRETVAPLYATTTFILPKWALHVFNRVLSSIKWITIEHTLSLVQKLELQLGYGNGEYSKAKNQAKHETLESVRRYAITLTDLSVTFKVKSEFKGDIDAESLYTLQQIRGLENFKLTIEDLGSAYVGHMQTVLERFVKLARDDKDYASLDKAEKKMLESEGKFAAGLKRKIWALMDN